MCICLFCTFIHLCAFVGFVTISYCTSPILNGHHSHVTARLPTSFPNFFCNNCLNSVLMSILVTVPCTIIHITVLFNVLATYMLLWSLPLIYLYTKMTNCLWPFVHTVFQCMYIIYWYVIAVKINRCSWIQNIFSLQKSKCDEWQGRLGLCYLLDIMFIHYGGCINKYVPACKWC
jgi:hypothetical protein